MSSFIKERKFLHNVVFLVALVMLLSGFSACAAGDTVYSFPNLIASSERESAPIRPINGADIPSEHFAIEQNDTDSMRMQLAELLQITAQKRSRPVFDAQVWPDVRNAYQQAVNVLDRYMKNEWNDGAHDFEKVLAIHDYLASEIEYDYDLYQRSLTQPITDEDARAFEITGVFLEKKAVCDGLSKAFILMCAIEGIEARYVRGSYEDATGSSLHAWNKVKIDGIWYNVDVTLDNFMFNVDGTAYHILNHGYFLRSDRMMYGSGGHIEDAQWQNYADSPIPASGESDYGFYDNRPVPSLDGAFMTVTNAEELRDVFTQVRKSKNPRVGAVELRLDFTGGGVPSEDVSDYADAIAAAYQATGFTGLNYTAGMEKPPFAQYPGGVFVFLIYI